MAGTSKLYTPSGRRSGQAVCPLNLLPCDIWVRVATEVAYNSIQSLLNFEATCKVFLDTGRSDVIYKHAMVWNIPLVSSLRYPGRADRRFIDQCIDAGNPDSILRDRLHEYFFIARRHVGMDLLTRAASEGNVEADDIDVRRGVDLFEVILTSGKVHRCREMFTDVFAERWVSVTPSDPRQPVTYRSPMHVPYARHHA
ncbi:hypothetical protein Ahy_B10g102352 [Arachis hypogaea]|uniref:At2g35280-like TPR domain-containing protein n=1 Tax=Arachis hypogaea TaxID=3818 RepID=A0A444X1J7_ARAHY|nr:hypothetical protein Ahy_B10g102352 [Arachis hypogaea]